MLMAAAFMVPMLSALALFVRSSSRTTLDWEVIGGAGLLLPALNVVRLPTRARAHVALAIMFGTGVYVLARVGTAAGVSVLLVTTSVIAFVCLGRRLGLALILATAAAHIALGMLVVRGTLMLR
jgi:hypothetical protein